VVASGGSLDEGVSADVSKRHELDEHRRTLGEISGIMRAMRNLSLMETHKLSRLLAAQERVVANLEAAAADFLSFYRDVIGPPFKGRAVFLLIGSERGFCGDFNEALVRAFEEHSRRPVDRPPFLITVGRKLAPKVTGDARLYVALDGPAVAEEIQPVLIRVMEALHQLHAREKGDFFEITVFYHTAGKEGVSIETLQPFETFVRPVRHFSHPPRLTLEPFAFLAGLIDLYFFSVLHQLFYSSLMAENRLRLQHMDNASRRLDKESADLKVKRDRLRQEEITEEIEIIMLSAERVRES
jgi:F-type H+-transporting ATPase subunit gamma